MRREECREPLTIFSLQKAFREAKSYATPDCWDFYTKSLAQKLHEVIDYEMDEQGEIALEGESNLYPALLRTNLQNVCLPHATVDNHELRLKGLVGRRNGIAHGQKLIIADLPTYQEFENAAGDVMYDLAYAIIESLESQGYLRPVYYEI